MRPVLLATLLLTCGLADASEATGFLEQYAQTYRFRLGRPTSIRATPDGAAVLFLRSGPRSFVGDLYEMDVATGDERLLLSAATLLGGAEERLSTEEKARRERQRLAARGIASYELSQDGERVLVPLSGRLFVVERRQGRIRELPDAGGTPVDARFSPDGTRVACVREGELYVIDVASAEQRKLTTGAGGGVTHGLAEFVAQEEMSRRHGYWWSPDGRRILYQQTDTTGMEVLHIQDATDPAQAAESWPYPRPGKRNARVRLGIIPSGGGPTTWVRWDAERFEYLAAASWQPNAPPTIVVQDRRQSEMLVLALDPADGTTRELLRESDPAWVEIDETMPRWRPDGSGFFWTTERRGTTQLELRRADGTLDRVLTPPGLGFRRLAGVLADGAVVVASSNPVEQHVYRIAVDPSGGAPRRWTSSAGWHHATVNRDGTLAVLEHVPLEGSRRWEIRGAAGPTGRELRSVAEEPPFAPNLEFTTTGGDPDLHAVLVRPRPFEAGRAYPVVVQVYGGPTSQMVRADPARYLLSQWIADRGFVVLSIDGRGTPNRGREWLRAVKHDLSSLPLEDQAQGLRSLGARYRELDMSRVGIFGWSFGGYVSAMAVMRRPDVFHAAVAGAPVTDWRDYDTHYTERYLDSPDGNPEGYRVGNVLTWADRLSRPLLIVHGTADDNVYFAHSLKLANALFRHGRPFEFLPLAGFTHMVPDALITRRLYERILTFLEQNLRQTARPLDPPAGTPMP